MRAGTFQGVCIAWTVDIHSSAQRAITQWVQSINPSVHQL